MKSWTRFYCLLAGGMDSLTGLLLVAAPVTTLRLMGVAGTPAEPIFLRWIGVFVGAVGLAYLYPFLLAPAARPPRLRSSLEITTLVRLCVAGFVAVAVGTASLERGWALVGVTDGLLAGVQIALLTRGVVGAAS